MSNNGMQSDWESPQWDSSQGSQPTPGQPDPADQAYQQPPTAAPTWDDFGNLVKQFHDLTASVREGQHINAETTRALSGLLSHIQTLQPPPPASVAHAGTSYTNSTTHHDDGSSPRGAARFREPKPFKGKPDEVSSFLLDINDAVRLSRNTLPTELDKCIYMASFFEEGIAKQWYISVRISQTNLLSNFEKFCEAFQSHFGNPNVATSAKNKIDALVQSGSVAAYAARYFELLVHVDWSDQTKIDTFYKRLKPAVKDIISYTPANARPQTFKEYVDFTIDIDNRVHEREVERRLEAKSSSSNKNNSTPRYNSSNNNVPTSPQPPVLSAGVPMEIDATKTVKPRGPLTDAEKKRRREHNLCLYCGGANHKATDCPNMTEAAKKRFTNSKTTSSGKA